MFLLSLILLSMVGWSHNASADGTVYTDNESDCLSEANSKQLYGKITCYFRDKDGVMNSKNMTTSAPGDTFGATKKQSTSSILSNQGSGGSGGGGSSDTTQEGMEKIGGISFPSDTGLPDPEYGIAGVLGNLFAWLMVIFGIVALAAFVLSGIQYLIASGSDDMAKIAKRNLTYSLVGVIVGLSGYVIVRAIQAALSADTPYF